MNVAASVNTVLGLKTMAACGRGIDSWIINIDSRRRLHFHPLRPFADFLPLPWLNRNAGATPKLFAPVFGIAGHEDFGAVKGPALPAGLGRGGWTGGQPDTAPA